MVYEKSSPQKQHYSHVLLYTIPVRAPTMQVYCERCWCTSDYIPFKLIFILFIYLIFLKPLVCQPLMFSLLTLSMKLGCLPQCPLTNKQCHCQPHFRTIDVPGALSFELIIHFYKICLCLLFCPLASHFM